MKNATPTEIANYITNTGCKSFTGSCPCLDWGAKGHRPDCTAGHLYIALTPFGLPSHLVPHNPAGLSAEQITEGGKWRCGTANDFMQTGVFEYWKNENTGWVAGAFGGRYALHLNPDFTYRLPADTPFPDWEEMSKAVIESEIPPPPINRCPSTFPHPAHDYCPGVPFGKRATVKESSTAQPATEDSSTPQPAPGETLTCPVCDGRSTKKPGLRCPECRGDESYIPYMKPAPGETPETDAYIAKKIKEHGPNWPKNLPETLDFAQNLERQRDQAIREVSEQGRRIGELESDLQQAYNARNRARMEEEQKWRPQLEAANADRARLRGVLKLIQPMVNAIPAELWKDSDNVAIPINKALSTPPPEMVSKAHKYWRADLYIWSTIPHNPGKQIIGYRYAEEGGVE